jgi:hypothetical protein
VEEFVLMRSFQLSLACAVVVPLVFLYRNSPVAEQPATILSTTVPSLVLQNVTMEDALRALRATNQNEILIGFEKVPHHVNAPDQKVSLEMSNATVAQILTALCQKDPRYTYEIVDGLLIHVHPRATYRDFPDLLDTRIHSFSVEGTMLPAAVINRIGELAPELSSYLAKKQDEYYEARGITPSFPGSTLKGNMDPKIKLNLHDLTVRQILDAVIIYSLELNKKSVPDWTGNKLPPTSWIYDFTIDPAASTGLRGYPKWIAF